VALRPEVATNSDGSKVADAINAVIADALDHPNKAAYEVWIASAYFNPQGFALLAEQLERVQGTRLLLGAEPLAPQTGPRRIDGASPRQQRRNQIKGALDGHVRTMREDRDVLGFTREADVTARRLIAWLRSGQVEVRRFERDFLHGKTFLIATDDHATFVGSSNFTHAGLATNHELNVARYDPTPVAQVKEWYAEHWERAVPFDLAAVYEERFEPHDPYVMYLRMLWERYGRELEEEAAGEGQAGVHLTSFQRDGVWRAKRILDQYHGVVIADGVGLGKTFLGGAIVEEYVKQRRQRVLIIAPAALRDGPWKRFLSDHQLFAELTSYEEFAQDPQVAGDGGKPVLSQRVEDYALVIVDEGHAFRNPETKRAESLRGFLSGLPVKDLVLLTATPVNNSLFDLYNLLSLFIKNDAAFADRGILSLRRHFAEAAATDPDDLSPEKLFDVLDAVAVRRTRRFVKDFYADAKIAVNGAQVTITFPKVVVEPPVGYDLDPLLPGFFERLEHALNCASGGCEHDADVAELPTLHLARYAPSRFLHTGESDAYEAQLAGLLRSGLLKRFESSVHAFALTCERMAASHDSFLSLLEQGRVATGQALADWTAAESDELRRLEVPEEVVNASFDAREYDAEALGRCAAADRDLLRQFAAEARAVQREHDPKLAALVEQLAAIAAQARDEAMSDDDERNKRKVLVFTYFADTVDWITAHLADVMEPASPQHDPRLAAYAGRMTDVSGDSSIDKTDVMWGFAPKSAEAPPGSDDDRFDLLVCTDVLAEGVNLQQARHIVNFDLPWNPMRLVQRHGRIDRIGSEHDRAYIRCFFPDRGLDRVLRLEERLKRKLAQAAASVGVESETLPGSKVTDVTFAETREEIERLRRQDPTLFEAGGESGTAYSGEEYRQELRRALEDPALAERIKTLPWGSGSGMAIDGAQPGFVFCVRVGDSAQPLFRWVGMADLDEPRIVGDTLACLAHAHADASTARVLDEETHRLAYRAWAAARRDVFDEWMRATDPRELQPEVPRAMRDAAALLTTHTPTGMDRGKADELVAAVAAPYPPRIQAVFRAILRTDASEQRKADRVAAEAERLGLEPSPPPEPLPVIAEDDIHLVCWQAVTPSQRIEPEPATERQDLLAPEQTIIA
jgi:hypothetical protein